MRSGIRAAVVGALMVAASLTINAGAPQSESGEIQLQLARQFFADGRYLDALGAFQAALTATVPADAATIRHSDAAVSDSESRANLRNNQSGPVRASEDADRDPTGGTAPANGAPAAGVSGRQGTGTAPEAEGTK